MYAIKIITTNQFQDIKIHKNINSVKITIIYWFIAFLKELMLSQLHGHVEREESRWLRHTASLQQQLDEARDQLDERILRDSNGSSNNRQNSHYDSEDGDEDFTVVKI